MASIVVKAYTTVEHNYNKLYLTFRLGRWVKDTDTGRRVFLSGKGFTLAWQGHGHGRDALGDKLTPSRWYALEVTAAHPDPTVLRRLARIVDGLHYDAQPAEVVAKAKAQPVVYDSSQGEYVRDTSGEFEALLASPAEELEECA